MRTSFNVNDMTIHRIVEQEQGFTPVLEFLPGLSREVLDENRPWLEPAALDRPGPATGVYSTAGRLRPGPANLLR